MAQITITSSSPTSVVAEISERGRVTTHVVDLTGRDTLVGPEVDGDDLVRRSLGFLLEREPGTSILRRFALVDVTRYFPEFPEEIRRRTQPR